MQAQGHIVVQLSSDRHRQTAERSYLEQYCGAKAFDGVVDCVEEYDDLTMFERLFLSEIERNIMQGYEVKDFELIAGKLTEDIPSFVRETGATGPVSVIVDVRHAEVTKLEALGLNQLVYSLISIFCREYIGQPEEVESSILRRRCVESRVVREASIRTMGVGEGRYRRGPEGWERQVVTQRDVAVIDVAIQDTNQMDAQSPSRLLVIVDEDARTNLSGHYIRLPSWAYRAYGDLVLDCEYARSSVDR